MELREIEADIIGFFKTIRSAKQPITANTELLNLNVFDASLQSELTMHVKAAYDIQLTESELSPQHRRTVACLARLLMSKILHPLESPHMLCSEFDAFGSICKTIDENTAC